MRELYHKIDTEAAAVEAHISGKLSCRRGCHQCCVDDISVFDIEAENIREHFPRLLQDEHPHPAGKCAFLGSAGECRIYDQRPYVCRTQGLPLRWLRSLPDGTPVEYRDICPLNETQVNIEVLNDAQCWLIGPTEGKLAEMQRRKSGEPLSRILLRDLFNHE